MSCLKLLAAIVVFASALYGDTIYEYTGVPFTTVSGALTTSDYITATLDFAGPLPDNAAYPNDQFKSQLLSFEITDGVETSTTAGFAYINTDASGNILTWNIEGTLPGGGYLITDGQPYDGDLASNGANQASEYDIHGTWTEVGVAASPEPSSAALLLAGSALIVFRRRRSPR